MILTDSKNFRLRMVGYSILGLGATLFQIVPSTSKLNMEELTPRPPAYKPLAYGPHPYSCKYDGYAESHGFTCNGQTGEWTPNDYNHFEFEGKRSIFLNGAWSCSLVPGSLGIETRCDN